MQSRNTSRSICAGTVCRCENVTANTVNNAAPLQREVEILALPWLDLGRPPCLYHHFQRLPPNHHPESRLSPAAAAEEACNTKASKRYSSPLLINYLCGLFGINGGFFSFFSFNNKNKTKLLYYPFA